ncbi:MAG: DUF1353 domain-containing protein [Nitrospinota bacterium]
MAKDSRFLTTLRIEKIGRRRWRLTAPLLYRSRALGRTIEVPKGFQTDLVSISQIPLLPWLLGGRADRAGVVHDYLYQHGKIDGREIEQDLADWVFREAAEATGVPPWARWMLYRGVQLFGGRTWRRYRRGNSPRRRGRESPKIPPRRGSREAP